MNDEPENPWGGLGDERWTGTFGSEPTTGPPPAPAAKTHSPRSRRIGMAAATAAFVTAVRLLFALVSVVWPVGSDHHAATPTPAAASRTTPLAFYGDLAQTPPEGVPRGSVICTAEIRMRATGGAWTCANWTPTGSSDVVLLAAGDSSDPCTHRVVEVAGDSWTCETTIAPPPIVLNVAERSRHPFVFADLSLTSAAKRAANSVCTQEVRPEPGGGPWHCTTWLRVDPRDHWRVLRAIDPGGSCTLRSVDESTGVWVCETGGPYGSSPAPTKEVYYGDTAMPKPGRGKLWARQLCVAEIRASPDRGAWTCASWMGYDSGALIRAAHDPGKRCTHRVVQPPADTWTCETTTPAPRATLDMAQRQKHPIFFTDLTQTSDSPGSVCTQETRTSPTGGPWKCTTWQQLDASEHWRLAQPIDPGGPCTLRTVDELTGVWTCGRPAT